MTFRCADSARERSDPMLGTAPPQRSWLLVEHPGPWPVSAPFDAGLTTDLLARLGHPTTRVVLIRRPGRRRPVQDRAQARVQDRAWAWAEAGMPLRWGRWSEPADLLAALDSSAGSVDGGPARAVLVCSHGVHDLCCAVRGRPVAAALTRRWPEEVWECSHLGGDRFAANALMFPEGACYGGLEEGSAVPVLEAHRAGRPVTSLLRGVVGWPPPAQVALVTVHERFGPAPLGAARVIDVVPDGERWRVEVAGRDPLPERSLVTVGSTRRPEARLTCRAVRDNAALAYEATDVEVLAGTAR